MQSIKHITEQEYIVKDILSMEYIYDLIYGNTSRMKTFKEISKFMDLDKIPQMVLTILCDNFWNICEALDNRQRYHLKRKILNTVRNAIVDRCKGVATSLIGTDKVIVLIDCYPKEGKSAEDFAIEIAKYIKAYVKEKTSYTVTIGISSFYKDYRQLWKAYEESFQALTYSFIHGNDSIIQFNLIKPSENMDYEKHLSDFEQNLIRYISNNSLEKCYKVFEDICKFLTLTNDTSEVIKSIIIKILFAVVQYCYNIGVDFHFISRIMIETMVTILKTNSFKDMEEIGKKLLTSISNEIKNLSVKDKNIVMYRAATYMEKYFTIDLKLEEVAEVCNLSQYHFSRLFKNFYGKTFVQYLTELRMDKACKLLKETDLTITEITEKVGYKEIGYFSRIFKKNIGISPKQYRTNS
ncbi:helix-turn-helix domain-containing protein [Clostridiaceae bacterium 35-E11]